MASAGARAYNWDLGSQPPARSRVDPLVKGQGRSPKPLSFLTSHGSDKFAINSLYIANADNLSYVDNKRSLVYDIISRCRHSLESENRCYFNLETNS